MKIPDFELERWKAKFVVPGVTDLTETGIPEPLRLREIMTTAMVDEVLDLRLDYATIYGSDPLRERIAALYSSPSTIAPDNVLVTSSTSEANMIAVNTIVNNGDEVLVQMPSFMQIPGLLEANGVRIRKHYLREENGWEVDIDELNETVTSKTKLIALNYPNNPTGRVLDEGQVRAICEIAKDRDAWIVVDEVYRGIEFTGPFSPSFAQHYEKAVVSSSLSKVWGLPGLRVGWMIGPRDVVERGSAFKEYTTLGGSLLSEHLATMVLEEGLNAKLIERGRRLVRESFQSYDGWIQSRKGVLSYIPPKFGVITLVKHNLSVPSSRFADKLWREKRVAVIPCDTCFPEIPNSSQFLRISYCHRPEVLDEALRKIDEVLDEFASTRVAVAR